MKENEGGGETSFVYGKLVKNNVGSTASCQAAVLPPTMARHCIFPSGAPSAASRVPAAKQGHDEELHESRVAMKTVTLAAGEVVGLPPRQPELKAISAPLCGVRHPLGPPQVTIQEAPEVR
ncbi:hypothetical protein U1Q18_003939 [Sarracenia purpurea var. burkii]